MAVGSSMLATIRTALPQWTQVLSEIYVRWSGYLHLAYGGLRPKRARQVPIIRKHASLNHRANV